MFGIRVQTTNSPSGILIETVLGSPLLVFFFGSTRTNDLMETTFPKYCVRSRVSPLSSVNCFNSKVGDEGGEDDDEGDGEFIF